jgi:hypothetical protein
MWTKGLRVEWFVQWGEISFLEMFLFYTARLVTGPTGCAETLSPHCSTFVRKPCAAAVIKISVLPKGRRYKQFVPSLFVM